MNGYDASHRIGIRFDGVTAEDPSSYTFKGQHADVMLGPGPFNLGPLKGDDVKVSGRAVPGKGASCEQMFAKWPGE